MGPQQKVLGFVQVNVTGHGASAGRKGNGRKMDVDPESRRRIRVAVMQQYRSQRRAAESRNEGESRVLERTIHELTMRFFRICTGTDTSSRLSSELTDESSENGYNDHLSTRSQRSPRSPTEDSTTIQNLASRYNTDNQILIIPSAAVDNLLTRNTHNQLIDATYLTTLRTAAWWPERSCGCNGISTLLELHQRSPHEPRGPATDALTLLTVGEAHGDARLVMEGRRKHLMAIQRLREQVARPARIDHTEMVTTIEVLLLCESLRSLSRGRESWAQHCDGLAAVVASAAAANRNGRGSLAPRLDHVGMLRVRHVCLMSALYNRRALDARLLESFTSGQEPAPGAIEKLVQLALVLPTLLESSDQVSKQGPLHGDDGQSLLTTSSRLRLLDTELRQWLADYQSSLAQCLCCCDISADFAVQGLFRFPWYNGLTSGARKSQKLCMASFHITNCYAFLWTCRLLIHQALLDLEEAAGLKSRPSENYTNRSAKSCSSDDDDSSRDLSNLTHSLRETIQYFAAIPAGSNCRMITTYGPLYFMNAFYTRVGGEEGISWCTEIENTIRKADVALVEWDALAPWSFPGMIWALFEQLK